MNRFLSLGRLALALWVLAGLAGPLQAADDAPFQLSVSIEFVDQDGKFNLFALEGMANHLGPFTGLAVVSWHAGHFVATWTLETAKGETLELYLEFSEVGRNTGHFAGIYEITGGTDRFADATGSGTCEFSPDPDGVGFVGVLEGTISY